MAQGVCNNHGTIEAVWKEGTSKAGNNYAFWGCPVKGKDPKTGEWWKCRVEVANTPDGKFNQEIDKAAAQMDNGKKDELITRTAIAKSLIEAGQWKWSLESSQAAENWLAWVKGQKPFAKPSEDTVARVDDGEVSLEDIPF